MKLMVLKFCAKLVNFGVKSLQELPRESIMVIHYVGILCKACEFWSEKFAGTYLGRGS